MSNAGPMHHTNRLDNYSRGHRRRTPRQMRRYWHKLNSLYGSEEGATPRRAAARAAMLERRRGYEDLEAAWQAGATLEELR